MYYYPRWKRFLLFPVAVLQETRMSRYHCVLFTSTCNTVIKPPNLPEHATSNPPKTGVSHNRVMLLYIARYYYNIFSWQLLSDTLTQLVWYYSYENKILSFLLSFLPRRDMFCIISSITKF